MIRVGDTISHCQIIEKIGTGGMGIVYKALDTKLNRNVALKFLPHNISHNPEIRKRFKLEAQAAAALNHPNIATIHSTEEVENEMFIEMELVEGIELSKEFKKGSLDLLKILDYAIQIAKGLRAAHNNGVVHRDIKSSNIMVTESGIIKIMDFGLAKLTGLEGVTKLGTTLGTINYMSPEQTRGEEVDHRTDIWSLGVILFEMLTGKMPFKGNYEQAIVYSILNEEPKLISADTEKEIQPELEKIIYKTLAKRLENRYQNANDLLHDLNSIKKNIETGMPVELIESGKSVAEYVSEIQSIQKIPHYRKYLIPIIIVLFVVISLVIYSLHVDKFSDGKHLAVLPFINIGQDSTNQAFVDGLLETLTNKISQLEQFTDKLWVVPASEMRKSNITSASEANKKFGVNLVISGSVERLTKGYRININLIDAKSMRQSETREIDDPMTSTSFLQDKAIIKIAEMLNLELKPESLKLLTAGKTTEPAAYELYIKGRGKLLHYDKEKNVIAAIKFFKRAINIDSSFALAYAGLGEAYLERYQDTNDIDLIDSSIIYSNHAIKLNKSLIGVRIILGRIYLEQGKYQEALNEFKKVLLLDQKNSDAYRERAETYLAMNKPKEAELSYKEAIKAKPNYWKGYNYLGVFYARQGKFREAASQFQHVILLNPNNAKGYRNLGGTYYYLGRSDEAIEAFKKSLLLEDDYRTYANIAVLYYNKGNFKEAARAYEKVVKMKNSDYRMWGFLADTYYRIPDEREKADSTVFKAIKLAEKQLDIKPNDVKVLAILASYYGMLKDSTKTRKLLKQVEHIGTTGYFVPNLFGQVYEEWLGNRAMALKWIKIAIKKGYPTKELKNSPGLKNLLKDKNFKAFLDSLNNVKNSN